MQPPIESITLRRPPGTSSDLRKTQKNRQHTQMLKNAPTVRPRIPKVEFTNRPGSDLSSELRCTHTHPPSCSAVRRRALPRRGRMPSAAWQGFCSLLRPPPSPSPFLWQHPVECRTPTPRVPGRPLRLPGALQGFQDGPGRPPRPPTWSYMPPRQPKIAPRGPKMAP